MGQALFPHLLPLIFGAVVEVAVLEQLVQMQADQTQEMVVMGQHLQSAALLYLMPGVAVAAHSEQVLTQVLAALVAAVLEEMAVVERLELLTQVAVVVGKAISIQQPHKILVQAAPA